MRIFLTGGCKTGKSTLAQRLAVQMRPVGKPLYYIATMAPMDGEDEARIARHRAERAGLGFETVEAPRGILSILDRCGSGGAFLFDSVTALLANEMFREGGAVVPEAYQGVIRDMDKLLAEIGNIAVVSDYIFSDARLFDGATESYRFGLAEIHKRLAQTCDAVVEVCYGNCAVHKGSAAIKGMLHAVS